MPFPGYYDPTATQVAADRIAHAGLSSRLWRDFPEGAMANNPGHGFYHLENFSEWENLTTTGITAKATFTESTAGQVLNAFGVAGATGPVLALDSEAGGADQGGNLQFLPIGLVPTAGHDIFFEARIAITDAATMPFIYAGLASVNTAIIDGDPKMAVTDWAGFYHITTTGVLTFGVDGGTTQSITTSTIHTMVDAATSADGTDWVKVGCRINGTAGGGEYYVNGTLGTDTITWSNGPDTTLYPSFVCQGGAAVDTILYVDWYAVGQIPGTTA